VSIFLTAVWREVNCAACGKYLTTMELPEGIPMYHADNACLPHGMRLAPTAFRKHTDPADIDSEGPVYPPKPLPPSRDQRDWVSRAKAVPAFMHWRE
jgi:hypothetical protein